MKVVSTLIVLIFVLLAALPAQINLLAPNSFGTIANFDETTDDRTWSSIECNGAQIFEIIQGPVDEANMTGLLTSTACTDEGFILDQTFVPLDFSLHKFMVVDVYAPAVDRTVAFKIFKSSDPADAMIVEMQTTKAGEWDTLRFDFSGAAAGMYDQFSIHPDFGGVAEGEEWFFDNIRKTRGGLIRPRSDGMLIDFDTLLPYTHHWGSSNTDFFIEANPDTTGINKSATCGLLFTAADVAWEGFAIAEKFEPFDFYDVNLVKVKVLAPEADMAFMFKVELWENSGINVETVVQTEVGGEWEEMLFDLSGIEEVKYTKLALFPDFLGTGDGDDWYIDDVQIIDPINTNVDQDKIVKVFALSAANYPNPFNPTTTISYTVPLPSKVKVSVFDVTGRALQTLVNEEQTNGQHTIQFDGSTLTSGVYFYKIETSYDVVVNKMVLTR